MPTWLIHSTPWYAWLLFFVYVAGNVVALRLMRFTDGDCDE